MGACGEWVIPLLRAAECDERTIGGKAAKLAKLAQAGFHVPDGFAITTDAYKHFVAEPRLARVIRMELGRKPLEAMRWEEIWDTALRIRAAFSVAPMPAPLARAIGAAVQGLGCDTPLAVRSSAPGEDSAQRSFAGLHESVVGVVGIDAVLQAVRVVWASLWSDAALLYRQELGLDPARSCMAVVVQEMINTRPSGVAFGRDPRDIQANHAVVEAVPGPCGDLVDGLVDPDRWILDRTGGRVLEWRPGIRQGEQEGHPLLVDSDLSNLLHTLLRIESVMRWPPDTEWTGQGGDFTVLQARPITMAGANQGDARAWYLSLRPGARRLTALGQRVVGELLPELEALGERFAAEALDRYDDQALAAAVEERYAAVQHWRQIYLDDFIPFAHGVRQLGLYYNDAVHPEDPYEFVGLLRGESMLASQRNRSLRQLADQVTANDALRQALAAESRRRLDWGAVVATLQPIPGGSEFLREFEDLMGAFLDVAYGGQRLSDRPDLVLETVLEMTRPSDVQHSMPMPAGHADPGMVRLEQRLLAAVGEGRHDEARQVLALGRLSWRLRDDDNLLVGRLESQLLRALGLAADRLRAAGRLRASGTVGIAASSILVQALQDRRAGVVALPPEAETELPAGQRPVHERPRQLVGQPASPGLATGRAQWVRGPEDLGRFRAGQVLVCDAIQPTMTYLVPLACAIVERRGGMLIHGAIIARELGIPCVNGVAGSVELIPDGEVITVDGYLGIVTVGPPELDLETGI